MVFAKDGVGGEGGGFVAAAGEPLLVCPLDEAEDVAVVALCFDSRVQSSGDDKRGEGGLRGGCLFGDAHSGDVVARFEWGDDGVVVVDADGGVCLDLVGVEPGAELVPDRLDGGRVAPVADVVGADLRLPDDGGLQRPILRHRGRGRLRALDDPLGVGAVPAFAPLGGGHLKAPFEHPDERRLRAVPAHTGDVGDGGAGVGDEKAGGLLEPDRLDHLIEVYPHLRLE